MTNSACADVRRLLPADEIEAPGGEHGETWVAALERSLSGPSRSVLMQAVPAGLPQVLSHRRDRAPALRNRSTTDRTYG